MVTVKYLKFQSNTHTKIVGHEVRSCEILPVDKEKSKLSTGLFRFTGC